MVDGDTLEGIALKLWGDASYWYMIAEVNGLTGGETLVAGQNLSIPNKVHNAHNSSDVYRVYDPNEIIGSTSPTNPKAPKGKGNKCGAFGQILLIAIAVAVTAVTAGGAAAAIMSGVQGGILGGLGALATAGVAGAAGATLGIGTAIAIGAGAAALGSVVSQGLGVATGIQDKFSFKGVALAALAGGAAVGLAGVSPFGGTGAFANLANFAARGALGSVLSQGIGVATGLQNRFSFANVATAGIGAAVGGAIGGHTSLGRAGAGMAGGIAAAAGESLITGNSFGDTLMRSLPSIIGNTIGNLAADAVAGSNKGSEADKPILLAGKDASPQGGVLDRLGKYADEAREWVSKELQPLVDAGISLKEYAQKRMELLETYATTIVVNGYRAASQIDTMGIARNVLTTLGRGEQANANAYRAVGGAVVQRARSVANAKVGPEFYAVQPPMSFFDMHVERPQIVTRQITGGSISAGVAEGVALIPATRMARGAVVAVDSLAGGLKTLGPGWRVLAPAGEGAATGVVPNGYRTVSRWVGPDEAAAWMAERGTGIPTISGTNRMYVTGMGAAKPGGTGPIRIDFAVPETALQKAGGPDWFQIFQPSPSRPVYNVQIHVPDGTKIPGY